MNKYLHTLASAGFLFILKIFKNDKGNICFLQEYDDDKNNNNNNNQCGNIVCISIWQNFRERQEVYW